MSAARERGLVDAFNRSFAIGDAVYYRKDDDNIVETTTRTQAAMLSGHTAVVWLNGVRGCVAVGRVTARDLALKGGAP